jgi:hypothetical protein
MGVCPRCGFSYAWDGVNCGHCHSPDSRPLGAAEQENRIESRILKRASHHGLPACRTFRFEDLKPGFQEEILTAAGKQLRGRPVLAFVDSPQRWTLLTTRAVLGLDRGRLWSVDLQDLTVVTNASKPPVGASTEEVGRWKGSWEYLRLEGRNAGVGVVWVPCGGQAYALWNILLAFTRGRI